MPRVMEDGKHRGWKERIFGRTDAQQGTRIIHFPPAAHKLRHPHGGVPHYRGNRTSTTKYTLLTFLPKSLFEQYRRVANIYFTLNAALSITPYSPVRPWTTFLPLGLVLGIAMIKEAVEDYKRYRQDVEVNNRRVQVFDAAEEKSVSKTWADVRVGDIITVFKDEYFPADILFLSAGNEEGLCYIETMQLDGETNLKIKKALDETKHLTDGSLRQFTCTVECEPPNNWLYHFTGNLEVPAQQGGQKVVVPVAPASVLLRGCSLRNTHKVYGLVLYAGHDTKIFKNATQPPSKRSRIERTVDRIILFMFALLFAMCLVGCIYFAFWTVRSMPFHWYLDPENVPKEYDPSKPGVVAVTNFITAFILYSYLIPISLYVSIEMVKIVQAFVFIGRDRDMYHAETDTPAVARTSNLNEELGMVNTVLTDKTGTLTRNVMEFFKASIGGVSYGAGVTEVERANAARRGVQLDNASQRALGSPLREQYFNFYDERLLGGAWARQANPHLAREFFRMMALCHTVIPDGPPDPKLIRYEAESPDEAALVVAAKVFGFFLFKRTNTTLYLRESLPEGVQEVEYEVLNILEFNSTRKRMSVVLRSPDNRILLYCKGADTVIYERLTRGHPTNEALREVTLQHMEDYGGAGLRTLCLAFKEMDPAAYDEWQEKYIVAKTALQDRQARVDEVSEEIECDLVLLGCTAIEDKLQEGVPQCIKALADANMRLWVLTGDKMETAINIGYACSLITDEMTQFQVTGHSPDIELLEQQGYMEEATRMGQEHVRDELSRISRVLREDPEGGIPPKYALVIDGKALLYSLLGHSIRQIFLEVSLKCCAVVCCRVSPLQKAQVTALVKSHGDVTLAIGDGANDVGMIQKAHIGVGISGQEGMQAVMAADFAIAQFRFLTPLLLVHGRLSYKRISRMILFFFYKNLLFGTTIFVYNAFAVFSGQRIYNDFYMTLFNVVFTAMAPLVVGWFDRDLDKGYGVRFPSLYREGQSNLYFNLRAITGWLVMALFHAALILGTIMVGAHSTEVDGINGHTLGLAQDGIFMFTVVVVTVHAQLAVVIDQWTWMHHASCWGSIGLWLLFLLVYGTLPIELATDLYKVFEGTIASSAFFWLSIVAVPSMCVLPTFALRQLQRYLRPAQYQVVQEIAARERAAGRVLYEGGPDWGLLGRGGKRITGMVARAGRLVQRTAAKAAAAGGGRSGGGGPGGRRRYSGFVAPYEARSRVFDNAELRASAAAAGYSISTTGEVEELPPLKVPSLGAPPGLRAASLAAPPGPEAADGGGAHAAAAAAARPLGGAGASGASAALSGAGDSSDLILNVPTSSAQAALPGGGGSGGSAALARVLGGRLRGPVHRRTASAGARLGGEEWQQGVPGVLGPYPPAQPSDGGALPPGLQLAQLSLGASMQDGGGGGGHTPSLLSVSEQPDPGFQHQQQIYAGNPVLEQLEREFTRDPRRHRHGAKLSQTQISAALRGPGRVTTPEDWQPPAVGRVRSPGAGAAGLSSGRSGSDAEAELGRRRQQQQQQQQQRSEHQQEAASDPGGPSSNSQQQQQQRRRQLEQQPSVSEFEPLAGPASDDPALLELYSSALQAQQRTTGGEGRGSSGGGGERSSSGGGG